MDLSEQRFARAFQKAVAGSDERRTRLHDRRGNLAPAMELVRLPSLVLARHRRVIREPWMARSAVSRLNELLRPDMVMLELGSGFSTAWYVQRVGHVISLEPSAEWAARTCAAVGTDSRLDLRVGSISDLAPGILKENLIDVVVVDHTDEPRFSRLDALRLLGSRVRLVVLDDSDRAGYRDSEEIMSLWHTDRFVSLLARPLIPTETTIYSR